MKKNIKIILLIIVVVIVLLVALAIWYGGRITPSVKITTRLDDLDLVYASQYWAGLCGNEKGDTGGCYTEMYLYGSGKFVKESGFIHYSDNKRDIDPTVERNLTAVLVQQIINKIKDSGVMEKDCPPGTIMDAGWDFQIDIDGVKRSFHNPPPDCRDTFDEVDNLINSILDYRE